ncbi:hypothetical protein NIES593_06025 [Hydrococcus rivularis NIES-593]|uniref:DUF2288 domain-containing protein n=1 Tax=Hydrococcus rivularis NIES-593 TaxID=1921803 RepID=A0A1U7HMM9_9CYAN|nr:DUF2288 domain-containing protein [Hydrococcus rivularis]OKH24775.1 hypothetical protein NIES593_06025 [Hydrococcus rivularis NIES-593]
MSDVKAQLTEQLAEIEWSDLIPHAQRDAVIVVNEELSIVDVGVAIANDNVALVQQWIAQKLIHKPSFDELSDWNSQPDKKFSTLIVQPFVLVCAA